MVTNEVVQPPRSVVIEFASSPMNWLFAFIPITLILEQVHSLPPTLIFFSAAMSIIPIAALIVQSTEQLAVRTGDAIGGLLNATFGNAPELIISFVALRAGYLSMVRASLIGAIMANLLLALGVSFLLGGLRNGNQKFNPVATRTYSTMMFVAAVSLAVPSAFSRVFAPTEVLRQEQLLNIGISIVLLATYGLFLLYSLKTHKTSFEGVLDEDAASKDDEGHEEHWSLTRALVSLIGASVLAAVMSEVLVGAAEGTGKQLGLTEVFIGIVFLAVIGGAAESGSAIVMARKNKMDLSIGIALGSSIQIALFVAPVLVLASYFIAPKPLDLAFNRAEIGGLGIAVLIGSLVSGDGQSNWFKGVQLLTIYAIIGLMFYLIPVVVE